MGGNGILVGLAFEHVTVLDGIMCFDDAMPCGIGQVAISAPCWNW